MEIKNIIDKEKFMGRFTKNAPGKWKDIGYARLPTRMLMDERLSKPALLVYWVLTARTFKGKESCLPSYSTIATEAHCAKNTAIKAVKELEALGYVSVIRAEQRTRKTNQYSLPKRIR